MNEALAKQKAGLPVPDSRQSVRAFLVRWADTTLPGTVTAGAEDTYRRIIRLYRCPPSDRSCSRNSLPRT